ncbi:VOC family protein [Flavimaricola marinus]|uniref:3-demethylubiquinone-9 3-methyltransferase n=1 Tax=Flavimaricola marinus TaxID=1819565 RepID=A0A238LG91_9RHOB|nr:VOC family protein [Flavimaricola marinus]SMY08699.1 3-demethylubiquinone-9 3-methyltransferase [Flavimaricola marinus]
MAKVQTCLWFDGNGEEAAAFYVGLIPDSEITNIVPGPGGKALIVDLSLAGAPYTFLNGGPTYKLSPAASIQVFTEDQEETDRLWAALTDGGEESRCAWCVDRFGVSWQVVPRALPGYIGGPDPDGARRATEAMMGMAKIDIAALKAAYEGAD